MNIGKAKSKKFGINKIYRKYGFSFFKIKTHMIQCNPEGLKRRELMNESLKEYQKMKGILNHLSFLKKIIEPKKELVKPSLVDNYQQVSNVLSVLSYKII